MLDSFAAKNAQLIARVRAAREAGDQGGARAALAELLDAYTRLGNREVGTVDEQNAYIVARRLGALPEVLADLGVTENDLPMTGTRRPSPPPPPSYESIAERFAHIGGRDDTHPPERFHVQHRPQDNMRYQGRLLPFAIIDRQDGKPVAWYDNRDWAEMIADTDNRLRTAD